MPAGLNLVNAMIAVRALGFVPTNRLLLLAALATAGAVLAIIALQAPASDAQQLLAPFRWGPGSTGSAPAA